VFVSKVARTVATNVDVNTEPGVPQGVPWLGGGIDYIVNFGIRVRPVEREKNSPDTGPRSVLLDISRGRSNDWPLSLLDAGHHISEVSPSDRSVILTATPT